MNTQPKDLIEESGLLFLQKLRQITGPMHARLEESRISVNLMKADISLEDYADYLEHMKSVISYHECFTFPLVEHLFPDLKSRRKLAIINQDLESLQLNRNASTLNAYKIETDIPLNVPRALGYMYVIEGSTLGGQMILKHINRAFGFDAQKGARFFAAYGNETGKLWKEFLYIFQNYAVTANCEDEIIAGAVDAFDSVGIYFKQSIRR